MSVTTLVPWFGSNRMLAPHVGYALAGCKWVGVPFAGGMSELAHINCRELIVNDLHRDVINLARVTADPIQGPRLWRRLRRVVFHADVLRDAQEACREPSSDPVEWAANYFIASWMGRNSEAGKDREFNTGLSIRWDAAGGGSVTRFHSAIESLKMWRKILSKATFTTMDVFDFLEKCKDAPGHGIYCDPPFPGAGDGYKHKFTDHVNLAKRLSVYRQTKIVMRYYDTSFIRSLYPDWTWKPLAGRKQSNDVAAEVLIIKEGAK